MSELIQQAVFTPFNNKYHVSKHRHDYVSFFDANNKSHFIDGGTDYCRRSFLGTSEDMKGMGIKDWCLTSRDSWKKICQRLLWGTRGKKGDEPLEYRPIASFDLPHLRAIIVHCPDINPMHKAVVLHWIEVKTQQAYDKGH